MEASQKIKNSTPGNTDRKRKKKNNTNSESS